MRPGRAGSSSDRVQAQAAAARLPLRAVRMVPEALVELPRLAGVARLEERRRLDAAVQRVGLARRGRARSARCSRGPLSIRPESARAAFRDGSTSFRSRRSGQLRSPVHARGRGPQAPAAGAAVEGGGVDGEPGNRGPVMRQRRRPGPEPSRNAPFMVPTSSRTSPSRTGRAAGGGSFFFGMARVYCVQRR